MKKQFLFLFCGLALFFSLSAAMCETETPEPAEPVLVDYTCKCTYVPDALGPNAGEPNKEETNIIKAERNSEASVKCSQLNGKYSGQFFGGTCLLQ